MNHLGIWSLFAYLTAFWWVVCFLGLGQGEFYQFLESFLNPFYCFLPFGLVSTCPYVFVYQYLLRYIYKCAWNEPRPLSQMWPSYLLSTTVPMMLVACPFYTQTEAEMTWLLLRSPEFELMTLVSKATIFSTTEQLLWDPVRGDVSWECCWQTWKSPLMPSEEGND